MIDKTTIRVSAEPHARLVAMTSGTRLQQEVDSNTTVITEGICKNRVYNLPPELSHRGVTTFWSSDPWRWIRAPVRTAVGSNLAIVRHAFVEYSVPTR